MARKTPKRELKRIKEEEGYRHHSGSYRYIRTNLERFMAIGMGTKEGPSWEAFAALLAREGQKNTQGGLLSRDSARRIFERASKDVQAKKAESQAVPTQPRSYPSRVPATWRPQEATPPPRPGVGESGPVSGPPANETPEERTARILANIRQTIKARSG